VDRKKSFLSRGRGRKKSPPMITISGEKGNLRIGGGATKEGPRLRLRCEGEEEGGGKKSLFIFRKDLPLCRGVKIEEDLLFERKWGPNVSNQSLEGKKKEWPSSHHKW